MLIKIDESVVEYIEEKKLDSIETNTIVQALNNLAKSYTEGYHIITGELVVFEYLKNFKLLDKSSIQFYTDMWAKFSTMASCEDFVFDYILVKSGQCNFNKVCKADRNIYEVPIQYFNSFGKLDKTKFVVENSKDACFYIEIGKYFIRNIGDYENIINIDFDIRNGGGSTSYSEYKYCINENKITLSIIDSDRSYPDDSIGETLKAVKKIYEEYKDNKIIDIYVAKVREKENLISPSLYELCSTNSCKKNLEKFLLIEKDENHKEKLKYLSLKDGVMVKHVKKNEESMAYYKELFEIQNLFACTYEEIDRLDKEEKLIGGIGSKHDEFIRDILKDGLEKSIEIKRNIPSVNDEIIKNMEDKLYKKNQLLELMPTDLREEWENISKKIVSWGCRPGQYSF